MHPFTYEPFSQDFKLNPLSSNRSYTLYDARFISAAAPRLIGSDEVPGEYYRPEAAESSPLVILLHGMGDTSLIPPRAIAKSLAGNGFACFIPRLVVHSSRTRKISNRTFHLSLDEWFDAYRVSVIEARQIVDWAATRLEIDANRIAILGISFGAFVAALTVGVEERLEAGVLIECGGNAVKINQLSRAMRTRYPGPPLNYRILLDEYATYLEDVAQNGLETAVPARRSFLTDPLTYAASIRKRPLLMINALGDELIPRQTALDLWDATGRQKILWLPGTHVTLWVWYPTIRRRVRAFLRSALRDSK